MNCINSVHTLSDKPATNYIGRGFIVNLLATLGWDFEDAVVRVTNLCNKFYGSWCCTSWWKCDATCFSQIEVEYIINSYDNLVLDNQIPEYNLKKITPDTKRIIESLVSQASGQPLHKVYQVMTVLYYKTEDTFVKDAFLYPLTVKNAEGYRMVAEELKDKSGIETFDDAIDTAWTTTQIILAIALFTGVVIGGIYVMDRFSVTKR